MKVIHRIEEQRGKGWLATVGFFDGVHAGHRYLIREMRRLADERGLSTVVFTFQTHPRIVLQVDYQPKLLNSMDEKLALLASAGIDYCVVMDFTTEMATCPASDFIVKYLAGQWHVACLLVGYDHRFGFHRTDGFEQYVAYGQTCGIEVLRASPYEKDAEKVSSSKIRKLLTECRVEEAAGLLSYPYRLKGHVVGGNQVGRTIGFPTANMAIDDPLKVLPGMGVYAVWVIVDNKRYKGMLSIGNRPTLNGEQTSVEVHILDFSDAIYDQSIEIEFIRYLRDNQKFENINALKSQLHKDQLQVEKQLRIDDFRF
jgi:riboflavin kinase/FMN adenylyltransferase